MHQNIIQIHLVSCNPNNYTPFGFRKLLSISDIDRTIINFFTLYLKWVKIININDHAKGAKVQFMIPFDEPQNVLKLLDLAEIEIFVNEKIRMNVGFNHYKNRMHWTRIKFNGYKHRYIIKGIPLALTNINIKDDTNAFMVNKILSEQFDGLHLKAIRWKRVLSDNSKKFINTILLESETPLLALQNHNYNEHTFKLKIDNIETNISIMVKTLNQDRNNNNVHELDKINNMHVKSTFEQTYKQFKKDNENIINKNNNINNYNNDEQKIHHNNSSKSQFNPSQLIIIDKLKKNYNVATNTIIAVLNKTNWTENNAINALNNLVSLIAKTNLSEKICINTLIQQNGDIIKTLNILKNLNNNNNIINNNNNNSHHHNNNNGGGSYQ